MQAYISNKQSKAAQEQPLALAGILPDELGGLRAVSVRPRAALLHEREKAPDACNKTEKAEGHAYLVSSRNVTPRPGWVRLSAGAATASVHSHFYLYGL